MELQNLSLSAPLRRCCLPSFRREEAEARGPLQGCEANEGAEALAAFPAEIHQGVIVFGCEVLRELRGQHEVVRCLTLGLHRSYRRTLILAASRPYN